MLHISISLKVLSVCTIIVSLDYIFKRHRVIQHWSCRRGCWVSVGAALTQWRGWALSWRRRKRQGPDWQIPAAQNPRHQVIRHLNPPCMHISYITKHFKECTWKEKVMQWDSECFSPTPCNPGVIERWELLQAQDLSKELRTKQNQQQWQQLNSDLNKVWTWLGETGEELEQQRRLDLSTDIQTIEQRIRKLKVSWFSFC